MYLVVPQQYWQSVALVVQQKLAYFLMANESYSWKYRHHFVTHLTRQNALVRAHTEEGHLQPTARFEIIGRGIILLDSGSELLWI